MSKYRRILDEIRDQLSSRHSLPNIGDLEQVHFVLTDFFHPGSQAEFGIGTVEEHCEQENRMQDLSLVLSGPSGGEVVP